MQLLIGRQRSENISNTEKWKRRTRATFDQREEQEERSFAVTRYVLQKYKRNASLSTQLDKMSSLQKRTKQETFSDQQNFYFPNARSYCKRNLFMNKLTYPMETILCINNLNNLNNKYKMTISNHLTEAGDLQSRL